MSRKSSVGRRKTFNVQTASPKEREKFFRLRNKAIRQQEDKDFELNQKLYEERLKLQKIEEKDEERKSKFKKALSRLNPFRKKENKLENKQAEGEAPLRTSSRFSRQIVPQGKRPRNVVYVTEKISRSNDFTLPEKRRNEELNKAERRIEIDPNLRKYYYKYAQQTLGGTPTLEEKKETKRFLNKAIGNYPKSRDQQNRFAVAYFMVNKYQLYRNVVKESGADKSYQRWQRKYAE